MHCKVPVALLWLLASSSAASCPALVVLLLCASVCSMRLLCFALLCCALLCLRHWCMQGWWCRGQPTLAKQRLHSRRNMFASTCSSGAVLPQHMCCKCRWLALQKMHINLLWSWSCEGWGGTRRLARSAIICRAGLSFSHWLHMLEAASISYAW